MNSAITVHFVEVFYSGGCELIVKKLDTYQPTLRTLEKGLNFGVLCMPWALEVSNDMAVLLYIIASKLYNTGAR